jgi:hypothetical protein
MGLIMLILIGTRADRLCAEQARCPRARSKLTSSLRTGRPVLGKVIEGKAAVLQRDRQSEGRP